MIMPLFNWFQTFSFPGRPVSYSVVAKILMLNPINVYHNWSSYKLTLTKLSQWIGILCSTGHKSLSFYLDKAVSFRLLISLLVFSLSYCSHRKEMRAGHPHWKHYCEKCHVFMHVVTKAFTPLIGKKDNIVFRFAYLPWLIGFLCHCL